MTDFALIYVSVWNEGLKSVTMHARLEAHHFGGPQLFCLGTKEMGYQKWKCRCVTGVVYACNQINFIMKG
eukprot:m.75229 g.75229  ORF g.75229 m.75229 type:complete len:70 (-) comp12490_c0_seq6:25-234(-)